MRRRTRRFYLVVAMVGALLIGLSGVSAVALASSTTSNTAPAKATATATPTATIATTLVTNTSAKKTPTPTPAPTSTPTPSGSPAPGTTGAPKCTVTSGSNAGPFTAGGCDAKFYGSYLNIGEAGNGLLSAGCASATPCSLPFTLGVLPIGTGYVLLQFNPATGRYTVVATAATGACPNTPTVHGNYYAITYTSTQYSQYYYYLRPDNVPCGAVE